jgi:hypothetical protein
MALWYLFISMTFNGQVTGTYIQKHEFGSLEACVGAAKAINEQRNRGTTAFCTKR